MFELRQTEVENLRVPARGHEDVGRLDVAMHDALGVRRVESVGNLHGDVDQRIGGEGTGSHPILEGGSLEEFHREEETALGFVDVVDGADVRMIECRGGACLALEALQRLAVSSQIVRKKFERDGTAEPGVFRLVHHAHAAAANLFDDAVMGDGFTDLHLTDLRGMCATSVMDWLQILPEGRVDRVAKIPPRRPLTRQFPANFRENRAAWRSLPVPLQ